MISFQWCLEVLGTTFLSDIPGVVYCRREKGLVSPAVWILSLSLRLSDTVSLSSFCPSVWVTLGLKGKAFSFLAELIELVHMV